MSKTTRAILALIALWGVIVVKLGTDWSLDAILGSIGLVATATICWWARETHRFAEANPAQAILDGAQFIEYKRFEAQAKGGFVLSSPLIEDPESSPIRALPDAGEDDV